MENEYKIVVKNATGSVRGEIIDYWEMGARIPLNSVGMLVFSVPGNHPILPELEYLSQIELQRRNVGLGVDWTTDITTLYYGEHTEFYDRGEWGVQLECPGILQLLHDREVWWYAGTTNRSQFNNTSTEFILKTVVNYNAGPNATTGNGRVGKNGVVNGLNIATDQDRGGIISYSCAWDNVLETLQKVVSVGGGDFDLNRSGPASWEFEYYPNQRGADRTTGSDKVVFTLENGNMDNPRLSTIANQEHTAILVLGEGEEDDRQTALRTSSAYPTRDKERSYSSRAKSLGGLGTDGNIKLEEYKRREILVFNVKQVKSSSYGVHYFLGDKVLGSFSGTTAVKKIEEIVITAKKDGPTDIKVETRDV